MSEQGGQILVILSPFIAMIVIGGFIASLEEFVNWLVERWNRK